jgi:hypothetical protein
MRRTGRTGLDARELLLQTAAMNSNPPGTGVRPLDHAVPPAAGLGALFAFEVLK